MNMACSLLAGQSQYWFSIFLSAILPGRPQFVQVPHVCIISLCRLMQREQCANISKWRTAAPRVKRWPIEVFNCQRISRNLDSFQFRSGDSRGSGTIGKTPKAQIPHKKKTNRIRSEGARRTGSAQLHDLSCVTLWSICDYHYSSLAWYLLLLAVFCVPRIMPYPWKMWKMRAAAAAKWQWLRTEIYMACRIAQTMQRPTQWLRQKSISSIWYKQNCVRGSGLRQQGRSNGARRDACCTYIIWKSWMSLTWRIGDPLFGLSICSQPTRQQQQHQMNQILMKKLRFKPMAYVRHSAVERARQLEKHTEHFILVYL